MRKILIFLFCILFFTGCYNYRDIDDVIFVTDTLLDINADKEITIYLRAFKGVRSSSVTGNTEQIIYYTASGKSILEAIRDLSRSTSSKLNFTQNKIIMFTEAAAREGLDIFLDFFNRDQEANMRTYVVIYRGTPQEYQTLLSKQQQDIGVYLWDVLRNTRASSKTKMTYLHDLLNDQCPQKQPISIVPVCKIEEISGQKRLKLHNSEIIKSWKSVGTLSDEQTFTYNLLINELKTGTIVIPNPQHDDYMATLEILKNKTKTSQTFNGETFRVEKNVTLYTTFAEAQKGIVLDEETKKELKDEAEKKLKDDSMQLFEEYREKGIDIFKLQCMLDRTHPHNDVSNIIENTDLTVNIDVKIEGSTDIKDALEVPETS